VNFKTNESATKLRGGYYTGSDVAGFLARWVLEVSPRRVLEPSCGDGAFIAALAAARPRCVRHVVACEREAREAAKARTRRPPRGARLEVVRTEFLEWFLRAQDGEPFDAALGNPPFIRYQYLDAEVQARAEQIFRRCGLRFTRHTNAWAPFVLASLEQLRPGGRLGMVVPAELLHILHAQSLRDHLGSTCRRVLVIDPEDLWFDRALQGVVLLLAEKRKERESGPGRIAILPTKDRSVLERTPDELAASAAWTDARTLAGGKWMRALLGRREQALLDSLRTHPAVSRLSDVADVEVGIVTGANAFFLVDEETVARHDLRARAHPMFGRSEHARGVVFADADLARNRAAGQRCHFLWFEEDDANALPEAARAYLASGEQRGLHDRYKCRIRSPWYRVPSVWASPVAMLKRAHHFPRLLLNRARALTTDTAYRVTPRRVSATALVAGFVNSLTLLSAELEGRHYGGGVLELVPSEIGRLPVVTPNGDARKTLGELDTQVRAGADPLTLI
jgi:adenine-specific DNA methylase